MRRFHLACHLVIPLLCGFANQITLPHELVPVDITTFVDAHFVPPFFLPLPFGRPPSLPHSRILATNARLPHFFFLASALRLPMRLAALLASVGCLRFMPRIINLTLGYCQTAKSLSPKVHQQYIKIS